MTYFLHFFQTIPGVLTTCYRLIVSYTELLTQYTAPSSPNAQLSQLDLVIIMNSTLQNNEDDCDVMASMCTIMKIVMIIKIVIISNNPSPAWRVRRLRGDGEYADNADLLLMASVINTHTDALTNTHKHKAQTQTHTYIQSTQSTMWSRWKVQFNKNKIDQAKFLYM